MNRSRLAGSRLPYPPPCSSGQCRSGTHRGAGSAATGVGSPGDQLPECGNQVRKAEPSLPIGVLTAEAITGRITGVLSRNPRVKSPHGGRGGRDEGG